MKKLGLTLSLLFLGGCIYSQKLYSQFNLVSNNIKDIQGYALNDSVFFTYSDKHPETGLRIAKSFWIDANGKANEIPASLMQDNVLCGITKHNSSFFYYYLGKYNDSLSFKIFEQKAKSRIISEKKYFTIQGELLDAKVLDKEAFLISYRKKTKVLNVIRILGDSVMKEQDFELPVNLRHFLKSSSGLIVNNQLSTIEQGSASLKMYLENRNLILTIDDRFLSGGNESKTTIVNLNLITGKQTLYSVSGPRRKDYSSYYHNNKLYRLIRSDSSFQCVIYNIRNGEMENIKEIKKEKSLKKHLVYFRDGPRKKVQYGNLHSMINSTGETSLLVQQLADSSEIRMVIGNFYNVKGPAVPVIIFPDPITLAASLIISGIATGISERPSISKYFYLRGNSEKGFDFEPMKQNPDASVRQIIDEYEISKDVEVTKSVDQWYLYLLYKGYLELRNGAIGIYQEKRGSEKKLLLLKY